MNKDKLQTGIRFERDMHKKIRYIAKQNKRSFNAQVEFLVQECIDEFENKYGEIDTDIDEE